MIRRLISGSVGIVDLRSTHERAWTAYERRLSFVPLLMLVPIEPAPLFAQPFPEGCAFRDILLFRMEDMHGQRPLHVLGAFELPTCATPPTSQL